MSQIFSSFFFEIYMRDFNKMEKFTKFKWVCITSCYVYWKYKHFQIYCKF